MNERILLVQLADIGDLILTTPALAALCAAKPGAHLALLTSAHAAPLVEGAGLVNQVIPLDRRSLDSSRALLRPDTLRRVLALRAGRFDTVVFFHHFTLKLGTLKFALIARASGARRVLGLDNGSGWFLTERLPDGGFGARHQAQYWLDLVALLGADPAPRPAVVGISDADRAHARALLPDTAARWVALHAGSGGYAPARRWEPEKFAAVADALQREHGARVVLVGGAGDDAAQVAAAMTTPVLDVSGKTTLGQLAALLEGCALFVGADSGVLHLAAAAGTRVVALYGPSNHAAWGPWSPDARVLRSGVRCSPCSYVGHGIGLRHGCPARTCMKLVTPAQVLAAAKHILDTEAQQRTQKTEDSTQRHEGAKAQRGFGTAARRHAEDSTQKDTPPVVPILGVPVHAVTFADWLERIGAWVRDPQGGARQVCTVNPEFVMVAQRDPNFMHILQRADLCVPDGVGLLWAARWLAARGARGARLPQRVTGSDGVPLIAERAARAGWRLFLLGAAPGVADKAADVLRARYPGVQIVGTHAGSPAGAEEDAIVARVNASRADLLLVAYGAPAQDKWIARNLPRLSVKMAMGVGGTFDFIAGIVPRAPSVMRRFGLEWLYRLWLQPWRIGRMMRLPRFVLAVLFGGKQKNVQL